MATKKKSVKKAVKTKSAKKSVAKRPAARKAKPAKRAAKPAKHAAKPVPSAGDAMRALARRIVAATTTNDDEATLALYAPDVESTEMGQPPSKGIPALKEKFAGWRAMTAEAHFEPKRVLVDGNTIVIEWIGRVTMAGSGKQAEMHEVAIHEIRDGKITREAYFYNPASLS